MYQRYYNPNLKPKIYIPNTLFKPFPNYHELGTVLKKKYNKITFDDTNTILQPQYGYIPIVEPKEKIQRSQSIPNYTKLSQTQTQKNLTQFQNKLRFGDPLIDIKFTLKKQLVPSRISNQIPLIKTVEPILLKD